MHTPLMLWEHLPSPQILLGLAQYGRADETTVIRDGMVCDNTVVNCSLIPHCSHLPPHREIRDLDLAHVDIRNAPSWPSQGLIRDTSGISLRLGIIRSWGASHPARTYRSMHATPYVGVALVPLASTRLDPKVEKVLGLRLSTGLMCVNHDD